MRFVPGSVPDVLCRAALVAAPLWIASCVEELPLPIGGLPDDVAEGEGEGEGEGIVVDCAGAARGEVVDLDQMAARFSTDIHPAMARSTGGCIACHADSSDRLMRMATTPEDTFFRIRAQGYFRLTSGGFADRVLDDSMPQGGPAWSAEEKQAILSFSCDLATVDDGGVPPDEEFPPDLLSPYTGPASTEYDNTFLTYDQLRARVIQAFDDDWVRLGVDKFSENIKLFGGTDFVTAFIPARQAASEFFVGLDVLAEDVCRRAVDDRTGPFAGIDVDAPVVNEPPAASTTYQAEDPATTTYNNPSGCGPGAGPRVVLCTNGDVHASHFFPIAGDYTLSALVTGAPNTTGDPHMLIKVDDVVAFDGTVPETTAVTKSGVATIPAGNHIVSVVFDNDSTDGGDRNLFVDSFAVAGPIAGTTNGSATGRADALAGIATVFERLLLRPAHRDADPTKDEVEALYTLMTDLIAFNAQSAVVDDRSAWSGVCEGLLRHPDFLFTRAPSFDTVTAPTDRERFLVVKSALDLMSRVPTADELGRFDVGQSDRRALVDEWLASAEFQATYNHRVRELLEFDGTPDGDEPARLWTFVAMNDRPLKEVLTAEYTVDENLQQIARGPEYGPTGLLTMKGYITGKPGLPHYNYAARVLTGFLGMVFEVPQEALDARATATAASTVDPSSICFSCHRLLTPLAHQRLKWDDTGNFRTQFDDGRTIDDSDQSLVADYPFKGPGLSSFSLVVVRKEGFIRRMANLHFQMAFGRNLRHEEDERTLYLELWNAARSGEGHFRDLLRTVLFSSSYTNPPAPTE